MTTARKVYIIGNNASNESVSDGGRIKIRLYSELIKKCSGQVEIIDLCMNGYVVIPEKSAD